MVFFSSHYHPDKNQLIGNLSKKSPKSAEFLLKDIVHLIRLSVLMWAAFLFVFFFLIVDYNDT